MNYDWEKLSKIGKGEIIYMTGTEDLIIKAILDLKEEIDDLRKENLELHNLGRLFGGAKPEGIKE